MSLRACEEKGGRVRAAISGKVRMAKGSFVLIASFFALVLFSGKPAFSEENVYRTSYVCRTLDGAERWKADTEIGPSPDGEDDIYVITEKGEGLYSGFKGKVSWTARLKFYAKGNAVRPLEMERDVLGADGEALFRETQLFDHEKGKVVFEKTNACGKKVRHRELRFKGDVVNRLILGMYIQKFLESGKSSGSVELLSGEPGLYKVTIRVAGKETIRVNGRDREAYKLCLDPELGLLSVVKVMLPKAFVWHSAKPEFEWLRYKGLEESLDSPRVEINTLD